MSGRIRGVCQECPRPAVGRGLCTLHYQRWAKANRASVDDHRTWTVEKRFWSKVDKNGPIPQHSPGLGPCWMWTGGISSKRYGVFDKPAKLAHRVSYEWIVGPIPEDLQIDHLCKSTRCVNPVHLEPVTAQINQHRSNSVSARNAVKTHCANDHPYSGENLIILPDGRRACRICRKANSDRGTERRRLKGYQ